jgi:hypothetical protein
MKIIFVIKETEITQAILRPVQIDELFDTIFLAHYKIMDYLD